MTDKNPNTTTHASTIPDGWVETTLGEVGKTITGKTPSKDNPEDWGELLDFITPTDLKSDSKYIENTARKLSENGIERFSKMTIPENSIIVTCIGSDMGKVVINKNDCLTNQQINSLIISKDYDVNFVYYKLKDSYSLLRSRADGGSTMPILNKSNFESLQFLFPPLPEQQAIASVLSAFDDKIELLRDQNKTLEQLGQTIFNEWFGKYGVDDELPDGWRVGKLGEVCTLKSGFAFGGSDFVEKSNTMVLKIKDLKGNGIVDLSDVSFVKDEVKDLERVQYFKLKAGDIVLAMSGNTTGKIGVVPNLEDELFLNQRVGKFFIDNQKYKTFIYFFLMSGNYEEKILAMGYGSAQPNINPTQIENVDIIYSDNETLEKFINASTPVFTKILDNLYQIQSLTRTRDELLPRLMRGEVRVNF